MDNLSLEGRVHRIKKRLEQYANDPKNSFELEAVSHSLIEQLKCSLYYPNDMLLILEKIGCMKNWAYNYCMKIDWWVPCTIECANGEQRCMYDLCTKKFIDSSNLLFFAYDCDAVCYFYDKSVTPWSVVACDGLDVSLNSQKTCSDAITWEDGRDVLSIIESWVLE